MSKQVFLSSLKGQNIKIEKLILAAILVVFLVAQLFTFEDFPDFVRTLIPYGWASAIFAVVLVVGELMALPYLLGMGLPKKVLKFSRASGFLALAMLSVGQILALFAGKVFFFGATLEMASVPLAVIMLALLWGAFALAMKSESIRK